MSEEKAIEPTEWFCREHNFSFDKKELAVKHVEDHHNFVQPGFHLDTNREYLQGIHRGSEQLLKELKEKIENRKKENQQNYDPDPGNIFPLLQAEKGACISEDDWFLKALEEIKE